MAVSESQKKASIKYAKANLKRVPLDLQKQTYEIIRIHAEKRGETVNGFIKRAIEETIDHDNRPFILDEGETAVIGGEEYDVFHQRRLNPRYDFPWNHTADEVVEHDD